MNPQPITITMSTIVTFVMTIRLLTNADSCMPRMSSAERTRRMNTAGMFMMPWAPPPAPSITSNGEWDHSYGTCSPKMLRSLFRYSLHAIATVAAPTAYSRHRSQPMIQAINSPMVA